VTKRLWTFIKDRRTDQFGVASLRLNDVTYTKCKDKAAILNNYFTSVFTKEDKSNIPPFDDYPFPDILPINITIEGVTALLSNLEVHKASDPDEVPATLLKNLASTLALPLPIIFQASLCQSIIPVEWKTANVVPLFKKGNRSNPNNYRLVSNMYLL